MFHVLLDAVLGALCALGVMRADFSREARQDRQEDPQASDSELTLFLMRQRGELLSAPANR
jgi:hypothetical protein